MTVVVDASALVLAGVGTDDHARALRRRLVDESCHAPHLIDAELGNVLRRRVGRAEISAAAAAIVLHEAPRLIDRRYEHQGALATAAWRLRHNLTFYDALYVALAAALGLPLLTLDRRLAAAASAQCDVEVVGGPA